MDLLNFDLFDKIINVSLITKDGAHKVSIMCPDTGRKPTISISGKILPSPIIAELNLRITNFLLAKDDSLSNYAYVEIQAGYKNNLSATIKGQIWNSYQETPGPDAVTFFHFLLGNFDTWLNAKDSANWASGTQLKTILQYCADKLKISLYTTFDKTINADIALSGSIKDFLQQLALSMGFYFRIDGDKLIVWESKTGNTGLSYEIKYLTTPPRSEAYGWNITAPWNPSIRPGDIVTINPRYMRQSNGGSQVRKTSVSYTVQTVTFDFSTTEEANSMILLLTEMPS